ncbi:MAG TPA: DinB family protein [Candidatus Angelobacter sp.]|jgi:uncharacterized damage-inducible protein DinB|nr:DinB family protein [Candidatus Angelobacter sp.]
MTNNSEPGVSFRELFLYNDHLAGRWISYFRQNPGAIDVEIGGQTGKLRNLVAHIFEVEIYFADRVLDSGAGHTKLDPADLDALQQRHESSHKQLLKFVETADADTLAGRQDFGPVKGVTVRKMLTQAALHSVHHWAQVAMAVRQAGFPTDKPQDIIITDAME